MSTLATVRNEVKANLAIEGSTQDTAIDGYIRANLRQHRQKRYSFLRRKSLLAVSSGNDTVTLPTNYSVPDIANLLYDGTRYTHKSGFQIKDIDDLLGDMTNATKDTGRPTACAINLDGQIEFDKTLDRACTVELFYFCQDSTLPTNDDDGSVMFDEGFDIIRAGTQLLYATFNEGDTQTPAAELEGFLSRLDEKEMFNRAIGQEI